MTHAVELLLKLDQIPVATIPCNDRWYGIAVPLYVMWWFSLPARQLFAFLNMTPYCYYLPCKANDPASACTRESIRLIMVGDFVAHLVPEHNHVLITNSRAPSS